MGPAGHYLVIQPSGARSWAVRYRSNRRALANIRSAPTPPSISRALASFASVVLRKVAEGGDPARDKKQARAPKADSIESIAAQFIERRHCANEPTVRGQPRRPSGSSGCMSCPAGVGGWWHDITRRDVLEVLDYL